MSRGAATREKINKVALKLFVEKGITETTIRDIASEAGVAEGTLYRHYVSKDELAWLLFFNNYTKFSQHLIEESAKLSDPREKIRLMIWVFCQAYDQDSTLFSYMLLSQHGMMRKLSPEDPHAVQLVSDIIAEGQAAKLFVEGDTELLAALVLGASLQPAVAKSYGRIESTLQAHADVIADRVVSLLV